MKPIHRVVIFSVTLCLSHSVMAETFKNFLHVKHQTLKSLSGHGSAWVRISTIKGDVTVTGALILRHTQVEGKIVLNGNIFALSNHSQANAITIIPPTKPPYKLEITIDAHTIVHGNFRIVYPKNAPYNVNVIITSSSRIDGNIEFVGKRGQVIIDTSSQIKGAIKNGKRINIWKWFTKTNPPAV